jgi:uncharacterized RDD family membrane protein YckC
MMCPVCKRDLAPTLSICLTCGAMINDTVREELETKISKSSDPVSLSSGKLKAQKPAAIEAPTPRAEPPKLASPPPKPVGARFETADLRAKKTSPTLVEFQTKKATVPEWRLQLQNSVRQKAGANRRAEREAETPPANQMKPQATSGANALKVEFVEDEQPVRHQNPRVASALKRIEESRRTFSNQPVAEQSLHVGKPAGGRNFPFNVVARSNENPARKTGQKPLANPSPKPMLVSSLKIEKKGFDTNKLSPPGTPGKISSTVEIPASPPSQTNNAPSPRSGQLRVEEKAVEADVLMADAVETDEIEDLAPLAMRFNAGLFDMIIGFFASLILLSPFMLSGATWISVSGFFAIAAAVAIVMFLYLTISVAFVGRTFGMRLFSLELVDVDENAYPTLHQAAVSSSVFLLSLAFAGIGFLPIFFNEERRAAHDILSGTILIREY